MAPKLYQQHWHWLPDKFQDAKGEMQERGDKNENPKLKNGQFLANIELLLVQSVAVRKAHQNTQIAILFHSAEKMSL